MEINPENQFCHIGIDISSNNDLSAVAFLFYYNKKYYAVVEYFVTESHISTNPKKELYKKWAEKGHINICPGELIDYNMIFDKIVEYADKYEIGFIGYDPYKARELISMINAVGGCSSSKAHMQILWVVQLSTLAMKRYMRGEQKD